MSICTLGSMTGMTEAASYITGVVCMDLLYGSVVSHDCRPTYHNSPGASLLSYFHTLLT